jgi:hypothetical protein
LVNIVGDVDSLYVEIDNLNDLLVGFYFIRNIDFDGVHAGRVARVARKS